MIYTITATLMTYDINKKYCHAMGQVVMVSDKVRLNCEELKGYFEGGKILIPKLFEAKNSVRMDYETKKRHITITAPKATMQNRVITFIGNPHVEITHHG